MQYDFEDLLLEITSKYDDKKEKTSYDSLENKSAHVAIQDEAQLLNYVLEKKIGKWQKGFATISTREIMAFKNDEYEILYYLKDKNNKACIVIKRNNVFILKLIKKTHFFKVIMNSKIFNGLNLSENINDVIYKTLKIDKYHVFLLKDVECMELIDEIFATK